MKSRIVKRLWTVEDIGVSIILQLNLLSSSDTSSKDNAEKSYKI